MQQEPSESRREVLEYATPAKPRGGNLAAWVEVFALGVPAGLLMSNSGYGFVCCGMFVGAVIGITTALSAGSHKVLFGLLGNAVAIATLVMIVAIRNVRAGYPMPELATAVPILALVVAGPGLFCGAVVWRLQKPGP